MSTKIVKLIVAKTHTFPHGNSEWIKESYAFEIEIPDSSQLETAKEEAVRVLDTWLFGKAASPTNHNAAAPTQSMPTVQPSAEVQKIPNLDLYDLERDSAWRSFRKDKDGKCSYPAEEGKGAWLKIKDAKDSVQNLIDAMTAQKLEKASLGLFEYKLSSDSKFLQRRPLKNMESSAK